MPDMTTMDRAGSREQLELQIAAVERDGSHGERVDWSTGEVLDPPAADDSEPDEPFGRWLLAQRDRGDWIDDLAAAARADRAFPRNGSPKDVGDRMQVLGADGDAFEQLEDAERCWRSL